MVSEKVKEFFDRKIVPILFIVIGLLLINAGLNWPMYKHCSLCGERVKTRETMVLHGWEDPNKPGEVVVCESCVNYAIRATQKLLEKQDDNK